MNDTIEMVETKPIPEAVALIDDGLSRVQRRDIIPAIEVVDLLLDVRSLLDGKTLDGKTDEQPLASAVPVETA